MNRILTIALAVLGLCTVLSNASVHAAPVMLVTYAAIEAADRCVEVTPPVQIAKKYCAKRHVLGLPCAPMPLLCPSEVTLLTGSATPEGHLVPSLLPLAPDWSRLYRPPRAGIA